METAPDVSNRIKKYNLPLIPDLVQLKYKSMAESTNKFFRGTSHLFFEDLSRAAPLPHSPNAWITGDLQIENTGAYKGSNRQVYFDINDFDESILGPVNWELIRMVTGIFIDGDYFKLEEQKANEYALLFLGAYMDTLAEGKALAIDARTVTGIIKKLMEELEKRKPTEFIKNYTTKKKKKAAFCVDDKKLFKAGKPLKVELTEHIHSIVGKNVEGINYNVLDACFHIAGTGSLGLKRYLFLLQGKKDNKDFVLLDMKESNPSSLKPYVPVRQPEWGNEAVRIVAIQKRLQNITPALLGTTVFRNQHYVIGEMQPVDDKVDYNRIKKQKKEVIKIFKTIGKLTASAHLRSCSIQGSSAADDLIEFGKSGNGKTALINYAKAYAEKVKKDYKTFTEDFKNGYFK